MGASSSLTRSRDRYEWSVSKTSNDVYAVIWMDKESEEEGTYTFIAEE